MNTIVKASWERVNLILTPKEPIESAAVLKGSREREFVLPIKNGNIIINVTNLSSGEMIDKGTYCLFIDDEPVMTDPLILKEFDNLSRVFRYRRERCALIIEPKITGDCFFSIRSSYMVPNKKHKRNFVFDDAKTLNGKLGIIVKTAFPFLLSAFYRFIGLFKPKSKDKVLFFSENEYDIKGNLKVLYDYFLDNKIGKTTGIFYNKFDGKPRLQIAKAVFKIAFSDIIIIDNYSPILNSIALRKNQQIVQLWHAGVGFKAVGYARFGVVGSPHPFRSSHRKYTTVIVDDERLIDIYKEVFAVDSKKIKPLGMPRLEGYLSKERIEATVDKIYNEMPAIKDKKVILFAPTFRGTGALSAHYDYSVLDLEAIYNFAKSNNFVFLIKMHPFVKNAIEIPEEYRSVIIDCYDSDINELIYVSDIMITDYSSCAYEFSFFNRPLVFFRYDKYLYEYKRPMHTLEIFTEKQYEVTEFDALMTVLKDLKDVNPEDRFSNMRKRDNECCSKIAKEILGDQN